jgi:hypothetical protein
VFLTPVTFVPGAAYVRGGTSFQSVAEACKDIADDDAAHPAAHGKMRPRTPVDSVESVIQAAQLFVARVRGERWAAAAWQRSRDSRK